MCIGALGEGGGAATNSVTENLPPVWAPERMKLALFGPSRALLESPGFVSNVLLPRTPASGQKRVKHYVYSAVCGIWYGKSQKVSTGIRTNYDCPWVMCYSFREPG